LIFVILYRRYHLFFISSDWCVLCYLLDEDEDEDEDEDKDEDEDDDNHHISLPAYY